MHRSDISTLTISGLYLLAVVLVVLPLVDVLTTTWPPRIDDFTWRYGALGLAAGHLHTLVLGLSLAMLLALWLQSARVLRWLGALMIAASVALIAGLGMFSVDFFDVRTSTELYAQRALTVSGAVQALKYVTASLVLALLGLGALRTVVHAAGRSRPEPRSPGIVSTRSIRRAMAARRDPARR